MGSEPQQLRDPLNLHNKLLTLSIKLIKLDNTEGGEDDETLSINPTNMTEMLLEIRKK